MHKRKSSSNDTRRDLFNSARHLHLFSQSHCCSISGAICASLLLPPPDWPLTLSWIIVASEMLWPAPCNSCVCFPSFFFVVVIVFNEYFIRMLSFEWMMGVYILWVALCGAAEQKTSLSSLLSSPVPKTAHHQMMKNTRRNIVDG